MKQLSILFLLVTASLASAQNKYHDVIRLKNGSIIKGTITDRKPNEAITILIGGRQTVTFYMEEIASMDKEGRLKFTDLPPRDRGYFCRNEMGASIRENQDWEGSYISAYPWMQTIHGYKWNRFLETGIGFGTDLYEGVLTVPFFVSISGTLFNTNLTPFYIVQYGDSFVPNGDQIRLGETDVRAKDFFRIGGGLELRNPVNSIYLSISYKQNNVEYVNEWSGFYYETTRTYRSFAVGIGMKF